MPLNAANPAGRAALPMKEHGPQDAPPVVFLHGFLGNADDWDAVAALLAPGYRCLCADLNALGRCGPEACRMERAAAAILDALNARAVARCVLVGYSMGGRLALYCALRHPERFTRLVLESASPGISGEQERRTRIEHDVAMAIRLEAMTAADSVTRAGQIHDFIEWWYDQPLFASLAAHPEKRAQLVASRLDADPAALAALLRGMGVGVQPDLWPELPGCSTPCLLAVGEEDRKFRILAEAMSAACPAMAVTVFGGCGHNVHWENPGGYTTVLKTFLAAH